MRALLVRWCFAAGLFASLSRPAVGQGGVTGGAREILSISFANGIPKELSLGSGLVVVEKDGVRMLRASAESEFRVKLPEELPERFTLEFDLVAKEEGPSRDLSFRGTNNPSDNFAEITWSPTNHSVVGGGLSSSSQPFTMTTLSLGETVAGQLARILVSFDGNVIKLYTNGTRLYTVSERQFARTRVLRVSLGGQNDDDQAVYLARLRVAEGAATATTVAQQPGSVATGVPRTGAILTPERPPSGEPAPSPARSSPPADSSPPPPPPPFTPGPKPPSGKEFATRIPPRTLDLSGFVVVGPSKTAPIPPRSIVLGGFTVVSTVAAPTKTVRGSTYIAPRTIALLGFTVTGFSVTGGATLIPPRTIKLGGFTATSP